MAEFTAKVRAYIQKHNLLEVGKVALVGISGGADSVCLFYVLSALGYKVELAHVNFGLRGEESDADEAFVRHLALAHNTPLHIHRAQKKESGNTQQWARNVRYAFFEEICQSKSIEKVAVAHHQNDNFETALFNLVKGGNWRKLKGISPQNQRIVRPFLAVTRQEIEDYLALYGWSYRTDSSNAEDKYQRNFLRNRVVPLLRQLNPSLEQTFVQSAERAQAAERLLSAQIKAELNRICTTRNGYNILSIKCLEKSSEPVFILSEWLNRFGFSYTASADIFEKRYLKSGKKFLSDTHILCTNREELVVGMLHKKAFVATTFKHFIDDVISIELSSSQVVVLSPSPIPNALWQSELYLASSDFPLVLRIWAAGDALSPNAKSGRRKVNKILTDAKLSVLEKQDVLVLASPKGILALVGYAAETKAQNPDNTQNNLYIALRTTNETTQ